MSKPAAVYLRVSSDAQTVENQRAEVEALCRARGYEPVPYEESMSAVKARPVFDRMLTDVRAGRVRAVVLWSLDRLHRSMSRTVADVVELDRLGVPVISVRETWLDTGGPARGLLVAIFGWVAEYERTRLIERTRAGLARARAEGKQLGRPRVAASKLALAVEAVEARGWSASRAALGCGVGSATLRRELRRRGTATSRDDWKARELAARAKNPA